MSCIFAGAASSNIPKGLPGSIMWKSATTVSLYWEQVLQGRSKRGAMCSFLPGSETSLNNGFRHQSLNTLTYLGEGTGYLLQHHFPPILQKNKKPIQKQANKYWNNKTANLTEATLHQTQTPLCESQKNLWNRIRFTQSLKTKPKWERWAFLGW